MFYNYDYNYYFASPSGILSKNYDAEISVLVVSIVDIFYNAFIISKTSVLLYISPCFSASSII